MEISAAILAGGRATRLGGADKASLLVGGVPIVERQLAALANVAGDVCIVVSGRDDDAARYRALGIPIVADAIAGAGPIGGLYTALLSARHDLVIVLACDLPFVSAALLERLAAEARAGGDSDAVVPRSVRGLEPLCAVYRKGCAGRIEARIASGDLRLTGLLAELRVRELGPGDLAHFDDGSLFENVNTPHDHARARGRVELDEKPFEDRITE